MGILPLPFETLPAPPQRQRIGSRLIAFGVMMVMFGLAAIPAASLMLGLYDEVLIVVVAVPVLVGFYGGAHLIGRGRRMRALPADY